MGITKNTALQLDVDALAVEVATIKANTDTLEASATTLIAATDTLEASATTLIAATDTLEASATAAAASLSAIEGYTDTLEASAATIAAAVDTEIPAIVTAVVTDIPATLSTIAGYLDTEIAAIKAVTDVAPRTLVAAITGEPNAGALTVATVGSQRVAITRLQIKTLAAVAAELTSLPVTGGPSGVVSFLSAAQAADTYFDAAGKGVSWSGYEVLEVGETMVVTRNGSGVGTDLNAIIAIEYVPLVAGGVLT